MVMKRLAFDRKHKLVDKWEQEVGAALRRPSMDIPVFVVRCKDGSDQECTLHRNVFYMASTFHIGGQEAQPGRTPMQVHNKQQ